VRQGDPEAIAELDAQPPLPPLAAHVWDWFGDLRRTVQSSGMGPARITRHDIRAWEQDEAISLDPWERRAILNLDDALIASLNPDKEA